MLPVKYYFSENEKSVKYQERYSCLPLRGRHPKLSYTSIVRKQFLKFPRKGLRRSPFILMLYTYILASNLIRKGPHHRCFIGNFQKLFKVSFLQSTIWRMFLASKFMGHSCSTYTKFSKKLTFLTPWYMYVRVGIRG